MLTESRRAARTTPEGQLVRLADQDRDRWDRDLIVEGQAIVRCCLRRNQPGPYQIQAAINAVHCDAPSPEDAGRADLLRRLGRATEAAAAYSATIARTGNAAERRHLRHRRDALTGE